MLPRRSVPSNQKRNTPHVSRKFYIVLYRDSLNTLPLPKNRWWCVGNLEPTAQDLHGLWRFNRHRADLSQDSQFTVSGAVHTVGDVECFFVLCLSSPCKCMASLRHDATCVHRLRPSSLFVINASLRRCLRYTLCTDMLN